MWQKINLIFLLLALVAEIFGTIGGFGSSVFFVPVANFYFDFESVLGLTAVFHLSSNLSKIALFRKGLNKYLLVYIGVPAVLFVILGGWLSAFVATFWLELCLGIFLIVLSLVFLIWQKLVIPKRKPQSIMGGILSGFFAGLLGTGGAIRGVTMAAFNLEKSTFIATSAAIDFGVDFTRTIVYFFNGYIHRHDLLYIPFLILIGFAGTYAGRAILNHIAQPYFKNLSLILILLIGLTTIASLWFKSFPG